MNVLYFPEKFLQIFRHGNRTAQKNELYPRDPYLNFTYYPFGNGQLTNAGKRREYNIGKELRERYNSFLGEFYYPELVEATSTNYNRTKVSLQLMLASLFPPSGLEIWKTNFEWQPVPYNYLPSPHDKVLLGTLCPYYKILYNQTMATPKLQEQFRQHKNTFSYISKNTGLNVTTFLDVYNLYFGLATEEEWGLTLPNWTKSVWPTRITQLAIQEYHSATATTDLKKMASGYLLKKIIEDTKDKITKLKGVTEKRMYIYSAHENNIAELLILLDLFKPEHVPPYGSYLIFEVHKVKNTYGFKVSVYANLVGETCVEKSVVVLCFVENVQFFVSTPKVPVPTPGENHLIYYQNYVSSSIQLLKSPACEEFCTMDKFISLTQEYMPTDDLCGI
ncbi:hypothetical protein NQ318_006406 [Aromia moschata]|uniref:acid phosphatase n=1 Tax=Aromia moschata TaxID=1265417 RepID=A0AAV8YIP0_9CUCU|nr:hypothetical protein NQ318_006406 [Aromia moschata]